MRPPSVQNAWTPRLASGCWSSRITRRPASASSAVATRPVSPAPTTMTSVSIRGGLLHAQDLRQRGAADLELALVRLARADHALDLEAGAADRARRAGVAVALAPGEDLDGRGGRGERHGAARERPGTLDRAPQQQRAGDVGGEHRRDEVRAAAVVLLVGVGCVGGLVGRLVGGDRLVLDAVVLGELAGTQGEHGGRERDQRRRGLAADAAHPLAQLGAPERGGGSDADHRRALERQLRRRHRLLDQRDHGERLAEPYHAAHPRHAVYALDARLAAGGDADLAVLVAHGGRPVGRAVHQQAVAQGHSAETELAFDDRTQDRSLLGSSWKKDAATPRSRTSMRSSSEWISGHVSYSVWWRWGKKPYAMQSGNASRQWRESVNAGSMTGTASAPSPSAPTQARIASISGDSIGERLPTTSSMNSTSSPSRPSSRSLMRAIVASAPMPGGTRQSTSSSALAGITLIFSPAETIVGATVTPSVGSNSAASRGSVSAMRASAPSGSSGSSPIARRNARGSSVTS